MRHDAVRRGIQEELARPVESLDLATVIEMMSASEPPRTLFPGFPGGVSR